MYLSQANKRRDQRERCNCWKAWVSSDLMFHLTNKNRFNAEAETGHVSVGRGEFPQFECTFISMTLSVSLVINWQWKPRTCLNLSRKVPEFLGIATQCAFSESTSLEFVVHRQLGGGVVLFLSLVGVFLTWMRLCWICYKLYINSKISHMIQISDLWVSPGKYLVQFVSHRTDNFQPKREFFRRTR